MFSNLFRFNLYLGSSIRFSQIICFNLFSFYLCCNSLTKSFILISASVETSGIILRKSRFLFNFFSSDNAQKFNIASHRFQEKKYNLSLFLTSDYVHVILYSQNSSLVSTPTTFTFRDFLFDQVKIHVMADQTTLW